MSKKFLILTSLLFGLLCGESVRNEAEVVFPQLFDARDEVGTRVLKINDKITLNLKKSSVVEEGFFLLTYRDGVPERTYPDVDELQEGLFHDESQLASVYVTEDSGFVKVDGVVGPNLKIKPLEGMERANDGFFPHVIDLIDNKPPRVGRVQGEYSEPRIAELEERSRDYNRNTVKTVYPEIGLVVDSQFYEAFNRTVDMVRYIMITFNVVKIRYLTVDKPHIHLKLRSLELLEIKIECAYYKYLDEDYPSVDGIATLYKLVDYVQAYDWKYKEYDIVYVLTGYDMVRVEGNTKQYSYQGFAFVGSVCEKHRVGFGEDAPYTYKGVRIWAHELAHTLGCSHDGDAEWSYLTDYYADSSKCPWAWGYIMSYIQNSAKSVKFSKCCDESISFVARSHNINCLHTITSVSRLRKNKTRTLPGYYLSRNTQCDMSYRSNPKSYYSKDNSTHDCTVQCCVLWRQKIHCWPQLLLDGSRCKKHGKDRHKNVCINGQCVRKRKWYPVNPVAE